MFVCLFVCWYVDGLMEIQTPALIWMKFYMHIPTCLRKVLVQVWPPLGPGGPKTLKAEGHIFKMLRRLQINLGSPVPQLVIK